MAGMKRLGAVLCLVVLFASPAFPQTAEEAVAGMESALRSFRTLRARFEQLYYSMTVSTPLRETGELYYQKPDRMRWEYKQPQDKVFLYRDETFSLFLPEENQLTRSRVSPEAFDSEILAFFMGTKALAELYAIEDASFPTESSGVQQVKLTPREEGEYLYLLLEIDLKTRLLRRVVFHEWAGNKQEFIFSRIRTDIALPSGTFVLKVPPDCEIIEDPEVIRR